MTKFLIGLGALWLVATAARYVQGDAIARELTERSHAALEAVKIEGVHTTFNRDEFGFRRVAVLSGDNANAERVSAALAAAGNVSGIHKAVWNDAAAAAPIVAAKTDSIPATVTEEPAVAASPPPALEAPKEEVAPIAAPVESAPPPKADDVPLVKTEEPAAPPPTKEQEVAAATCQDDISALLKGKTVLFSTGKSTLKQTPDPLLEDLAKIAKGCPDASISIAGHTDRQGQAEANERLSRKRANTVRDYLIAAGVAGSRLTATGYGESKPLDERENAEAYAANRRIEFIVQAVGTPAP